MSMRMLRFLISAATALVALPLAAGVAQAQDKISIGKIIGGSGFHIPSYVAMTKGFFKEEGLDARFITLNGKAQVTGALSGNIDFVPIPSGGTQAALSGAEIRYVVGQSLKSQWIIVAAKDINKPVDLKGKTVGYGRAGAADYDEGQFVMSRFFHMEVGKDYKVISFQSENDRIAALINGDIKAGLVSTPRIPRILEAGLKVLLRTGDYIPRAGGAFWTRKEFVDAHPETVKKFIRAIAKGVMYMRDNKAGSIPALKEHLGIKTDEEAGLIWDQLHNTFGAELPKELFRHIFESRVKAMIKARQWPQDKPMPDPEHYLMRDMLDSTLAAMHYVPTNLEAPKPKM
jgi:ABC-type nitrate/sulfonate/bicarbonate transport system substrate-binding protein